LARVIDLVFISVIVVLVLVLTLPAGAVGQEFPQEKCVNVSAERITGIGGWFVHDDIGFCVKYWSSETTGVEGCFLAPPGGGRLRFLAKAQTKLIDTCYVDGYLALGVEIPIGDEIDWQRFDGSGGVEWSFPDLPQFAISLEIGVSIKHYYYCWWDCEWRWESERFTAIGFHYYF
jgi:hypothetical protein